MRTRTTIEFVNYDLSGSCAPTICWPIKTGLTRGGGGALNELRGETKALLFIGDVQKLSAPFHLASRFRVASSSAGEQMKSSSNSQD